MSNYISYTTDTGEIVSERIGCNNSSGVIMSLFAVAYAASTYPDARRARRSVTAMPGIREAHRGMPLPWKYSTTEEVKELLALSGQDCFWAAFDINSAGSGFFQTPPQCSIYRAILVPLLANELNDGRVILKEETLERTAVAWQAMLPLLEQSPAQQTIYTMARIAQEAAACNKQLSIG